MATSDVIDLEKMLQPISDEAPSGVELKEDSAASELFYRIKDAREAARVAERALESWESYSDEEKQQLEEIGESAPRPPDWREVRDLATEILSERSKDLWVAAWCIEALGRIHGFAGLRDGFRLTHGLAEKFWDDIHPRPDEDEGYIYTVAQLTGLNGDESQGALITPIEKIPITPEGFTSSDYKDAVAGNQLAELENAATGASPEFYIELIEDLEQSMEEFKRLEQILDEKCGNEVAPPTSAIRHALEACRDRVKSLAKDLLPSDDASEEEGESGGLMEVGSAVPASQRKVMTREDAFRALLQVAEYFRKTEPHSPVSYTLEQAVRWGRMSLPDLLKELIPNESTREELFNRTGIPEPQDSGD